LGSGSQFKESEEEEKGKSRSMREEEEKLAKIRKEMATRRNQKLRFSPLFLIF
jgi:hypothetical protein